ncbi:MAG: hypothetical protein Q4Q62_05280, partial [Thermoplasmata archaeon]|nr:hypothetical protein [Thermoplasmata archaeon]
MNRKLAILERMFATDVILEVWNHPGSLEPNLAGMTPGYEKTKMTRVMEMLDAGIMTCERTQDGSVGLYLTDMGGFLAVRLMEINDRLVDGNPWATTETKPI